MKRFTGTSHLPSKLMVNLQPSFNSLCLGDYTTLYSNNIVKVERWSYTFTSNLEILHGTGITFLGQADMFLSDS